MTVATIATPDGYEELIATFGDIRAYILPDGTLSPKWEDENIERIPLPEVVSYAADPRVVISRIACHVLIADMVEEMHQVIYSRGLWRTLGPFGGAFAFRANRNAADKISTHAWGIAFDWDPIGFPNGSTKRRDPALSAILNSYGFLLGQDFKGTKDPMHFQFCKGY